MVQFYEIEDCKIEVSLDRQIVRIRNDEALIKLLNDDMEMRTAHLVELIKKDYFTLHDKELQITDDSLIVEIWGHVYFEYFTLAVGKFFRMKIINRLVDILLKRSGIIDCGEKKIDHNRKIWNMLAPYKSRIAKILPEMKRREA